jgi:Zn-dependent protease with chaperone function
MSNTVLPTLTIASAPSGPIGSATLLPVRGNNLGVSSQWLSPYNALSPSDTVMLSYQKPRYPAWYRVLSLEFLDQKVQNTPSISSMPTTVVSVSPEFTSTDPLTRLVNGLAKRNGFKEPFSVNVVNDTDYNAYVTDNNRVNIHKGLIQKASSPEELEQVLAHEMGHLRLQHVQKSAVHEHVLKRLTFLSAFAALLGATARLACDATEFHTVFSGRFREPGKQLLNASRWLALPAVTWLASQKLLSLARCRMELEADTQGVVFMRNANIQPTGLNTSIMHLKELQENRWQRSNLFKRLWMSLFPAHPEPGKRFLAYQQNIATLNAAYGNLSKMETWITPQEWDALKHSVYNNSN